MTTLWRRSLAFGGAVLSAVTSLACSVTTDDEVRPLDDRYRIAIDSKPALSVQTSSEAAIIYLIQGPDLIRRSRIANAPLSPTSVLEIVASGPTDRERESAVRSALGSTPLVIESLQSDERMMTIDLAPGFIELPGEEQMLLVGQIVLSMFENFPISSIRMTLAGEPTAVLGPGGDVIERPILPSDFRPLVLNLR